MFYPYLSGIFVSSDKYPTEYKNYEAYYIADGYKNKYFKEITIEFYGEKTQILF